MQNKQKKLSGLTVFNIDNKKQISILEWFQDHVTLE